VRGQEAVAGSASFAHCKFHFGDVGMASAA
jgi:hypothetical protein